MFVAGLDAHTRYVVVSVVNRTGERLVKPTRVRVEDRTRLLALLAPYRPLEVVMETSSSWPWISEVLKRRRHHLRARACAPAPCDRRGDVQE